VHLPRLYFSINRYELKNISYYIFSTSTQRKYIFSIDFTIFAIITDIINFDCDEQRKISEPIVEVKRKGYNILLIQGVPKLTFDILKADSLANLNDFNDFSSVKMSREIIIFCIFPIFVIMYLSN